MCVKIRPNVLMGAKGLCFFVRNDGEGREGDEEIGRGIWRRMRPGD